jgi:vacuolar protein sorting-associated protein 54
LNHPTKKADPLRGTRKPLPPIANPPPLPKPPAPSHYDAYLKAVTPLYDSFVNAQASSSTAPTRNGSLGDVESARRANLPPPDSVPDLFFDPSFDISSPAVWSAILDSQDDLSTHLDTLESHLIHEIGLRSTSFFSALSNLQDLHSESASCLNSITDLQSSLEEVGKKQARKGIEVIDKHKELRLLRGVETGIREIGEAQEALHVAQRLVEGGDWSGALGCLEDVVKWWTRHSSTSTDNTFSLPLADIPALSSLPSDFSSLTTMVASQLETALASLLSSILSRVEGTEIFDEERFRTSVGPMLEGFLRCGSSDRLQAIWREAVTTSIREGSRKVSLVSSRG